MNHIDTTYIVNRSECDNTTLKYFYNLISTLIN